MSHITIIPNPAKSEKKHPTKDTEDDEAESYYLSHAADGCSGGNEGDDEELTMDRLNSNDFFNAPEAELFANSYPEIRNKKRSQEKQRAHQAKTRQDGRELKHHIKNVQRLSWEHTPSQSPSRKKPGKNEERLRHKSRSMERDDKIMKEDMITPTKVSVQEGIGYRVGNRFEIQVDSLAGGLANFGSDDELDGPEVSSEERETYYKKYLLAMNLGRRTFKEREKQERSMSENIKYTRQYSDIVYNGRNKFNHEQLWLELQAAKTASTVIECNNKLCYNRSQAPDTINKLLNFKLAPYSFITADFISELLVDPYKLSDEYTDCLEESIDLVVDMLDSINMLQTLYPNQRTLRRGLAEEGLSTNVVERRLSTLHMWLNNANGLIHATRNVATLIGMDKCRDRPAWPFYEPPPLNHSAVSLLSASAEGTTDSPTTSNSSQGSDESAVETKRVTFSPSILALDVASPLSTIPASPDHPTHDHTCADCRTQIGQCNVYRHFVDRRLRTSCLKDMMKILAHPIICPVLKARYAINMLESAYTIDPTTGVKCCPEMKGCDIMPLTVQDDPIIIDQKIRRREDSDQEFRTFKDECESMCLPSLIPLFIFLDRTTIDITHECLKLRIEQAVINPSPQIVQQVVREYSEASKLAVSLKQCYQFVLWPVLHKYNIGEETLEKYLDAYNSDLKTILEKYFFYVEYAVKALQKEMTPISLKNFLEEQWNLSKEICPFVDRGMAEAGRKFCGMTSILLQSILSELEQRLDESLFSIGEGPAENGDGSPMSDAASDKLKLCREIKQLFGEMREKALKGIGMAKLLRKDLEIASEFTISTSVPELLENLKQTNHCRVLTQNKLETTGYMMFVPSNLKIRAEFILTLLDVTCGREDIATATDPSHTVCAWEGYLLLVNVDKASNNKAKPEYHEWTGDSYTVDTKAETTIALSHIGVKSVFFIVNHSSQLNRLRNNFLKNASNQLSLSNEQTSCHHAISEAMNDLRVYAYELANGVAQAIMRVETELDYTDLEYWDVASEKYKLNIQGAYRETLHQCYSLGFDLLQEYNRLVVSTQAIHMQSADLLINFAHQWIKFVTDKCEKGKGTRPRWANPGFDFLCIIVDPQITHKLTATQFADLKIQVTKVIRYIIGEASMTNLSPGSPQCLNQDVRRMQSQTSSSSNGKGGLDPLYRIDVNHRPRSGSRSISRSSTGSTSTSSLAPRKSQEKSPGGSSSPRPARSTTPNHHVDMPKFPDSLSPEQRSQFAIKYLEERRDDFLRSSRIIGQICTQSTQNNSLRISVRQVNFKWQRGAKIGEGQFGIVYTAVNCDNGEMMAMKEIRFQPNDVQTIKSIADELKTFEGIRHPNLVRYYGVELHREEMLIFMEYCSEGTLEDAAKQGLLDSTIRIYTRELVCAIEHLHEHNIIHRDIKGANIFLVSEDKLKLGDFGCSAKLMEHHTMPGEMMALVGTAAFMAPEVITQKGYGRSADIWSLGCVLLEMVTGKRPWHELDNHYQIMFKVGIGNTPTIPDSFHDEGKDFFANCFAVDRTKRATANQLLAHNYIKILTS